MTEALVLLGVAAVAFGFGRAVGGRRGPVGRELAEAREHIAYLHARYEPQHVVHVGDTEVAVEEPTLVEQHPKWRRIHAARPPQHGR